MNKKKLLGILVGCLSVSLLAGCSLLNQGGTTSGNPSENSSNNSSNNSSGNDVILNGPIYLEDGTIIDLPDNCEIELEDTFDFQTAAALYAGNIVFPTVVVEYGGEPLSIDKKNFETTVTTNQTFTGSYSVSFKFETGSMVILSTPDSPS